MVYYFADKCQHTTEAYSWLRTTSGGSLVALGVQSGSRRYGAIDNTDRS
jgi:hypothetical protein